MQDEQGRIVMISLYVDDLITIGDATYLIKEIKQQMSQVLEMKHLGELRYCLGREIWRNLGKTFMSQGKYVKGLLERFGMDQCKLAAVPLQQNIKLQIGDGSKEANTTLYRQLVGSLIYVTTTRLDLVYGVSVLSQYMSKSLESHWNAAKSVLRSITGYAFSIGSGVITWSSKKQNTVSLSSAEAEYQAMCAATCEAVWLRRLFQDVGEEQIDATKIRCDNQSSIKLANNPVFHKNTKHIDTQFHFVREKVQSKEIHLVYCNTKPLGKIKFDIFREMLGIFVNPFSIKGER
eukprot:PITA_33215